MDADPEALLIPGHPGLGGLLETFVFAELLKLKLTTFAQRETAVRHYRDRDKREVDFIIERRDGRLIAVEVKAGATPKSEDAKHLRWLRDHLADRFLAGYVLHLGTTNLPSGDRIFFHSAVGLVGPFASRTCAPPQGSQPLLTMIGRGWDGRHDSVEVAGW
jgi:predicted AAA+ superfamily ATPase